MTSGNLDDFRFLVALFNYSGAFNKKFSLYFTLNEANDMFKSIVLSLAPIFINQDGVYKIFCVYMQISGQALSNSFSISHLSDYAVFA